MFAHALVKLGLPVPEVVPFGDGNTFPTATTPFGEFEVKMQVTSDKKQPRVGLMSHHLLYYMPVWLVHTNTRAHTSAHTHTQL